LKLKHPWTAVGTTNIIRVTDRIWAKLETENPTGSIKDRPISYIVKHAIDSGKLVPGTIVVEATSGNTGISLSALCSTLGLETRIIMPSNMSPARRRMMIRFGASIVEVGPHDFAGAIAMRNEMVAADGFWSPMQFENPLNIECHARMTAQETLAVLPPRQVVSAFVSGAGTGGTIMGFRKALRARGLDAATVLVIPTEKEHGIQGIGDGGNYLVDTDLVDHIESVATDDAIERAAKFARTHGILVGPSSGANILASERFIEKNNPSGILLTVLCDRGERYLEG